MCCGSWPAMSTSLPSSCRRGGSKAPASICMRIETGGIIPDMPPCDGPAGERMHVIAVGGLGTEALMVPRIDCDVAAVDAWIGSLSMVIAGPNRAGRSATWRARVGSTWPPASAGADPFARLSGRGSRPGPPACSGTSRLSARWPPVPLTAGMWVEAGERGCSFVGTPALPGGEAWVRSISSIAARSSASVPSSKARRTAR